jgi:alpha-1,6-mannosyltransferase
MAACGWVIGARVGAAPEGMVALSPRGGHLFALGGWLAGAAALAWAWLSTDRRFAAGPTIRSDRAATPTRAAGSTSASDRAAALPGRSERASGEREAGRGRAAAVIGALWAVPFLLAPPLASRDVFAYACQGAAFNRGFDPYTAGAGASSCRWAGAVPAIWRSTPAPYGPLWIVLSGGAVLAAGASLWTAVTLFRIIAIAGIALGGWGTVRLARICGVPTSSALWLGVLSPLVLVHAVSGAHNDALATGLVVAGLALAAAGRDASSNRRFLLLAAACGLCFGLALAVKVTALVAAPFAILLLCRRWSEPPGPRRLASAAVPFAIAAAGAYGVPAAAGRLGFGWLDALRPTTSLVEWTSVPSAVGMAIGYLLRLFGVARGYPTAVAVTRVVGAAVLVVLLVALWWRARRAPGTAGVLRLTGAALAATVLLGPVFYPWYALTALAVLATCVTDPRVRRWLAAAAVALVFLVLPDGYGLAVPTKLPGALLVTAVLIAVAVRRLRQRR